MVLKLPAAVTRLIRYRTRMALLWIVHEEDKDTHGFLLYTQELFAQG
ncbi:hypothetical protein PF006_g12778 [Phytophthora fragariae]|uniref:Uncharacterized protein n=1 Tax=Phytophthora fragariae TaxID=53985 RepID=A0A6A3ML72_9STRA|nr:hypothetical protein PF011_g768 [Phytophthora fragariae]KAE9142090.1 hypothetical protein PF006_g12778 [Phytophthora fragariae]